MFRQSILLATLFTCLAAKAFGQTPDIEKFRGQIADERLPDTTRMLAKAGLAYELAYFNMDSCKLFAEQALAEAELLNFDKGKGRALCAMSYYYRQLGLYNETLPLLAQAKAYAALANDEMGLANAFCVEGELFLGKGNYEQALELFLQVAPVREAHGATGPLAFIYNNIGEVYRYVGKYEEALGYYDKAIALVHELNDTHWEAFYTINIGEVYTALGRYEEALEKLARGVQLGEEGGFESITSWASIAEGVAFTHLKRPEQAIAAFNAGLPVAKVDQDVYDLIYAYTYMGWSYRQLAEYTAAITYGKQGAELASTFDIALYRDALRELHRSYSAAETYPLAYQTLLAYKAVSDSIATAEANKAIEAQLAKTLVEKERAQLLETTLKKEQQVRYLLYTGAGLLLLFIAFIWRSYATKRRANQTLRRLNQEIQYQQAATEAQNEEITQQRDQLKMAYESVEQLSKIGQAITSSLTMEALIEACIQEVGHLLDAYVLGIGLYREEKQEIYFPLFLEDGEWFKDTVVPLSTTNTPSVYCFQHQETIRFGNYQQEAHTLFGTLPPPIAKDSYLNSLLYMPVTYKGKRLGVITVQSHALHAYTEYHASLMQSLVVYVAIALENISTLSKLEDKNKDVRDSIEYAKKIQKSVLLSEDSLKQLLPAHFMLYKPRDVVSGDFYWAEEHEGIIYLAVADCTGHGVPGALMSVICSNSLTDVLHAGVANTGELLTLTRERVIQRLSKSGQELTDGMDISLCAFDFKGQTVQWSGAFNPLLLINPKREVAPKGARVLDDIPGTFEFKADRQPIGLSEKMAPFTTHTLDLHPGDMYYLYTDGFQDQFGGPLNKKYMAKRLKRKLWEIHGHSTSEQRGLLKHEMEMWKGQHRQVDDVCLMGVRIP